MIQINNKIHTIHFTIPFLIFFSLTFTSQHSTAQCGPEDLVLRSQKDVDNFISNYGNCTEIKGNLIVIGQDVTNLDGLHQIKKVNGYLQLYDLVSLTDIDGLSSLDSIGGNLNLSSNDLLTNVDGFISLRWIGGTLAIYSNPELLNVDGFSALEKVGAILDISINPKLKYLDSLSNLKSIGKDLVIEGNDVMSDITGLRNIDPGSISGKDGLVIKANPKLTFCHLSNICTYLAYDPATHPREISLNADHCTSEQTIMDACNTQPICPLADVQLEYQDDLRRFLKIYPTCTVINGSLTLNSDNLTDLSPLHNLTTIKKILTIHSAGITDLNGLHNITSIGHMLWVSDNPNLTNLDGLGNLKSLGNSITILDNNSLKNVDGLNGLSEIKGYINIENNATLSDLNGFKNIAKIWATLSIIDNTTLSNIEGIRNISPSKIQSVTIKNNPLLPVCNYENICSFLETTKPRDIQGNAAGCMNEDSVKVACTMSANYSAGQIPVTLYPNPVNDLLTVILDTDASKADITILNTDAMEVYNQKHNISNKRISISASKLSAGIYFLHITLPDNLKGTLKFVKQ